jgi:4-amino-4-deoxy-L-arabinose transferase-like glycosyltransferase
MPRICGLPRAPPSDLLGGAQEAHRAALDDPCMDNITVPDSRGRHSQPADPAFQRARPGGYPFAIARALLRGDTATPVWERPALLALLGTTAILYLWNLAASGWANAYYSAAVQAGTKSWTAFFFGSIDASNFITVDKAPAALWVMEISARIFGFNAWSVLAPQALEGVATVALVYLAVRRWFGPAAGLLAGVVVALTPVAALMFRFNNPDALLVLLVTAAAYATLRAVEGGRTRWLLLAGAAVGFGFLAKELQALIVVPVLGGVYLLAGPPRLARRLGQLLATAAVLIVSGGWWVAVVELVPASARPYIGGSQDNSVISLIFGYNGFGRLTGAETGSVGGGGTAGSMWGPTGWNRLFIEAFGGQISWLIPGALILLAVSLLLTARRSRTDITRASLLVWGGTLLLTGAVISFAQGIIHPYYTVALAPAIGALVGIGGTYLWARRSHWTARLGLAAALAATATWSFLLLDRTPNWYPGLRYSVLVLGLASAILLVALPRARAMTLALVAGVGLVAALAAPAAYTLYTASVAHTGAIPSAGPAVAFAFGGQAGGRGGFRVAGGFGQPGGAFAVGGPPTAGGATGVANGGRAGGGAGGFLNSSQPSAALVALVEADAGHYQWIIATIDANSAAGYQLAAGYPVMAIGGFNGTDPAPTLAQFEQYVRQGKIHYFVSGGRGLGGGNGSSNASAITAWVQQTFTSTTVDGSTVYDLTAPK